MKIVYGAEEARRGPLRRVTLEQMEVPLAVQDRLREAFGRDLTPAEAVTTILRAVRVLGDEALRDYTRRLDGVEIGAIEVSPAEWEEGCASVPRIDLAAIQQAVERVRRFHRHQREAWSDWSEGGLTQRLVPLARVGCYVPAGSAPLPSTVVMTAIPAREAGVDEVVVASPPRKDGRVAPVILAACRAAGVDRVFRMGGAQALAALAYGTASVPRVDKIVGPGNLFVTLAKKMLFGEVGVDGLPGPTETLLLADAGADPVLCAADLLAQAEHDVLASALLITDSEALARNVSAEVDRQVRTL
ncbi:MAG: histidinol dehydrogenase, partial [Chloroflexi bacterium]|nr:histidinol dehydrogenase [Chloroflexota bacterium]